MKYFSITFIERFFTSVSFIVPKNKNGNLCSQNAVVSDKNQGRDFVFGKKCEKLHSAEKFSRGPFRPYFCIREHCWFSALERT